MKTIYIMLTQVGTMVSKSIQFYTKAKYNHASIGVDSNLKVFYSFARRLRYFPLVGGFITEVVNEGMFKYYPDTECIIYSLSVDSASYFKVRSILETYKRDERKYHYNLLALLGVIINKPVDFKYRHTCTEFVARLLHDAGIHNFNKHFSLIRPDDIPKIPNLQIVYEGKMINLNTQKVG